MYRKKNNSKYYILGIIIIVIIIFIILSITLKKDRQLNKFESLIKDTVVGVEKIVTYPFKFVINKVEDFKELINIKKNYDLLLPEVERIESLYAENEELRRQLESMKDELNITYTINNYSYLNATVINRNVSTWYNTITIDKGSYNGVVVDLPVVNSSGLIGKVISTTTFTSEVRLLTTKDTNNKISVAIKGTSTVYGVIKDYNYDEQLLEIEGISNTEKISLGDSVVTSGLGELFPSGILVGTVKKITTDEYDLAKIIYVTPAADFSNLNYVAVLKKDE